MSGASDTNTNCTVSNDRTLWKTVTSIWTLINVAIAIVISLAVIVYVAVIYMLKKNSKKSFHVSLILTCNTNLTIILSCISLSLMTVACIAGDQNITSLKAIIFWRCQLRGYLAFVLITAIYLSYVLQATYRLFRIVYHKHKYLRATSTFSYYVAIQWAFSFLLVSPMLFFDKNYTAFITYLPEEFACAVPFTNVRGITYSTFMVYLFPLCCLSWIYLWIIRDIRNKRRQSTITTKLRRQNKRDESVIKRICMVMIVLWTLCAPPSLFFITYMITGRLHWTAYRVCWMSMSISFLVISLSSLYVTPQIYKKMRVCFGCAKHHKKHQKVPYSIHISMEKEKRIESLLLEHTTFTDPNLFT